MTFDKWLCSFMFLFFITGCSGSTDYDSLGNTLTKKENVRTLEKFLNNGGDADTKLTLAFGPSGSSWILDKGSGDGQTLLMIAAVNSHVKAVDLLLRKGASANIQEKHGLTPLMCAVAGLGSTSEKADIIALLLKHGADPEIQDNQGKSALDTAADRPALKNLMINN